MSATNQSDHTSHHIVDPLPAQLESLIGDAGTTTTVVVIVSHETAAELGLVAPWQAPPASGDGGPHSALTRRRLDAGLAQRDLARRIGVQPSTVSRWERGITRPMPWARDHLCRILGLTHAELNTVLDEGGSESVRGLRAVTSSDDHDAQDAAGAALAAPPSLGLISRPEGI